MKSHQYELCVASDVFNLASEQGDDPVRVAMEAGRAAAAAEAAAEYERKHQRTLSECPGVVGFDAPRGPASSGKVMIEPGRITEAMIWLKRRFHVNESLELSTDTGLCVEIKPRVRQTGKHPYVRVKFAKPEQFKLPL